MPNIRIQNTIPNARRNNAIPNARITYSNVSQNVTTSVYSPIGLLLVLTRELQTTTQSSGGTGPYIRIVNN